MTTRTLDRIETVAWTVIIASALVIALMAVSACHDQTPILTPQGKVIYSANEVAKRVENLQTATIEAEALKAVPTDVARVLVTFTVSAAKTLKGAPEGWATTVAIAWGEAKKQIPLLYLTDPSIATYVAAVDAALAIWLPAPTGGRS